MAIYVSLLQAEGDGDGSLNHDAGVTNGDILAGGMGSYFP